MNASKDLYAAPNAPLRDAQDEEDAARRRMLFWGAGTSIILGTVALLAFLVIPAFVTVYTSFGADLPLLTRVMITAPWVWFALPLLALGLALAGAVRLLAAPLASRLLIALLVLTGVLVAGGAVALYLPIFQLGSVV